MIWWMLAMVAFPETQRRAQAELDAVIGRSRIPTFPDLSSLPYLRAMVKEVLRWRSSLPVGIPHRSLEDDWYEGMFIPKGTTCIVNVGLCNQDPIIYGDDATQFNPSRHLNSDGTLAPSPPDTQDEGPCCLWLRKADLRRETCGKRYDVHGVRGIVVGL